MIVRKKFPCSMIMSAVIVPFLTILATPTAALSNCDPPTSSYVRTESGTGSFAGISCDHKGVTTEAGGGDHIQLDDKTIMVVPTEPQR
jgi:hypothetical protein